MKATTPWLKHIMQDSLKKQKRQSSLVTYKIKSNLKKRSDRRIGQLELDKLSFD